MPGIVTWTMLTLKGDRCNYCDTYLRLSEGTWDHVIPFDRGGDNTIGNIVRCCTRCQRRKFNKTPAEYDAHRELVVTCALPGCNVQYKPRWAEWKNGRARYCSHQHAGAARWLTSANG